MNLPNKLTLLRVALIPVFLTVYLQQPFVEIVNMWLALVIFSVAAITDAVDGYLARRLGLVTNFGKLMDPLADKLLVCSALIAFTHTGVISGWVTIVLIGREFYVSGLRQVALERGIVLAASGWAKAKTAAQITLVIYLLLPLRFFVVTPMVVLLCIAAIATSAISAIQYTVMNRKALEGDLS